MLIMHACTLSIDRDSYICLQLPLTALLVRRSKLIGGMVYKVESNSKERKHASCNECTIPLVDVSDQFCFQFNELVCGTPCSISCWQHCLGQKRRPHFPPQAQALLPPRPEHGHLRLAETVCDACRQSFQRTSHQRCRNTILKAKIRT